MQPRSQTRQQQIEALVLAGAGSSDLRERFPGLAPATLACYRKAALRSLTPQQRERIPAPTTSAPPGGQRPWAERQPVSALHRRIGIKLAAFRSASGLNLTEFATAHGFANRVRLAEIERGIADPSLGELTRIADLLGTDVAGLLQPVVPACRSSRGRTSW